MGGDGGSKPGWVLVLEDDPDCKDALTLALRLSGLNAVGAENGREAIDILKDVPYPPRLIVADVMMPVMDGVAFCRWKETQPTLRDVRIVVLTAHLASRVELKGLAITRFLDKPMDLGSLSALAQSLCESPEDSGS